MKVLKVFFIMCLFWSCQHIDEIKKPDNLIPEKKMVAVLTELNLLNSAKNYNKRILEQTGLQPDTYLFGKFGIDSLQLAESTTYYAKNYDKFEAIYKEVQANLQELKAEMEVIQKEEQRKLDSIQLLKKENDTTAKQSDTNSISVKRKIIDSLGMAPVKYSQEQ